MAETEQSATDTDATSWRADIEFSATGDRFRREMEALRSLHSGLAQHALDLDAPKMVAPSPALLRTIGDEGRKKLGEVFQSLTTDEPPSRGDFLWSVYEQIKDEPWGVRVYLELSESLLRHRREPIFNGAILMSLVSNFESHLSVLASDFFHSAPGALNAVAKEEVKEFSLADLLRAGSVEAAVESAIESRVSALGYGNLTGWRDFFKERAHVDMSNSPDWAEVREIHERRHCVVHSNSIATERYVRSTGAEVILGDRLDTDASYLVRAFDVLEAAGVLLLTDVWRKFCEDKDAPNTFLSQQGFNAMKRDRWTQALSLYQNLLVHAMDEAEKIVAKVNIWLSLKNLNGVDTVRSEVEQWDTSAVSDRYRLAKAALLDDIDGTFLLIDALLERDDITGEELATWPLLQAVRADERVEKYRELIRDYAEDEVKLSESDQEVPEVKATEIVAEN